MAPHVIAGQAHWLGARGKGGNDMDASILDYQNRLNRAGFPCGRPDGEVGGKTRAATVAFQRAFAGGRARLPLLAIDGEPGAKTRKAAMELVNLAPSFQANEFRCKHCGMVAVHRDLLLGLQRARDRFGPIPIVSGYRCPTHNRAVGGASRSQHMAGTAADIPGRFTPDQMRACGFRGIGIKRATGRVLHVDVRPNPATWFYG